MILIQNYYLTKKYSYESRQVTAESKQKYMNKNKKL